MRAWHGAGPVDCRGVCKCSVSVAGLGLQHSCVMTGSAEQPVCAPVRAQARIRYCTQPMRCSRSSTVEVYDAWHLQQYCVLCCILALSPHTVKCCQAGRNLRVCVEEIEGQGSSWPSLCMRLIPCWQHEDDGHMLPIHHMSSSQRHMSAALKCPLGLDISSQCFWTWTLPAEAPGIQLDMICPSTETP